VRRLLVVWAGWRLIRAVIRFAAIAVVMLALIDAGLALLRRARLTAPPPRGPGPAHRGHAHHRAPGRRSP
jgi:hypothetical protein